MSERIFSIIDELYFEAEKGWWNLAEYWWIIWRD